MRSLFFIMMCAMGIMMLPAQKTTVVANDMDGWHKIASTNVDFSKDRDEVRVIGANRFARLKFKAYGAAVQLLDVEVHYMEGDSQIIKIGKTIKPEGESSSVDLKGGAERNIEKITLHYQASDKTDEVKAGIHTWGLKTNTQEKDKSGKKKLDK